jgi:hypothetical protein
VSEISHDFAFVSSTKFRFRFKKNCTFVLYQKLFSNVNYINPYTDFDVKNLFADEQRRLYEENLIQYWSMKSAIDTAIEEREIEIAKSF